MEHSLSEDDTFEQLKYIVKIDKYGVKRYYDDHMQLHREDGPAVVSPMGYKAWYIHGALQRREGEDTDLSFIAFTKLSKKS